MQRTFKRKRVLWPRRDAHQERSKFLFSPHLRTTKTQNRTSIPGQGKEREFSGKSPSPARSALPAPSKSHRGVKAHSARPWMGSNAIHSAAPALATLAAHEPVELEVDGLVYRESLNAVLIAGGIATNVIADECVITVNYRFAPSRDAAAAEAYLRQVFAGTPGIAEIRVVDLAEGARPGLDLPEAASFVAATGLSARPKYGWTDVARFSSLGVPAVNFGPGDPSLAHADNEAVAISEIYACEEALTKWLTA